LNSHVSSRRDAPAGSVLKRVEGNARSAAVVILPAIAGLNPYVSRCADALKDQGYASLSIDYYARTGGVPDLSGRDKVMAAVASLRDGQVMADVEAGVEYLRSQPDVIPTRIAVLGFCVGGTYAILAASSLNLFTCAISFYGTTKYSEINERKPLSPIDAVKNLTCPLLGHYGEADPMIATQEIEDFRARLRTQPAEIYTYPGAGHAFHEDFRPEVYRPIAATEAWRRSLEYLHWYCKE
jgi:dienelactone hydrolase